MREDHGDGVVEPAMGMQGRRAVGEAPRTTQVVSSDSGQVGALGDVPQSAEVGGRSIEEAVICKTESDETLGVESLVLGHALQFADLLVPAPRIRNLVNGVSVHGADAAVNGSVHAAVGALLGPTCVGVIEDSGSTDVDALQAARQLAEIQVLRSEDRCRLAILAELLEVICQRSVAADSLEGRLPQVSVGVDETRADDAAGSIDASGVAGDVVVQRSLTECGNGIALDQHRCIVQD